MAHKIIDEGLREYAAALDALGDEVQWKVIDIELVRAIHAKITGSRGLVRDMGLLESAVSRPVNLAAYEKSATLADLAASLGYGIIQNHPFVDANKRTGFMAMYAMLRMNGQKLKADDASVLNITRRVANGEADERTLARWIATVCAPAPSTTAQPTSQALRLRRR